MIASRQLSICHLAELTDKYLCSWCGAEIIRANDGLMPNNDIGFDIELTLRRWKEGDCDTESMLERLRVENQRLLYSVIKPIRGWLQTDAMKKGYPIWIYDMNRMAWVTAVETLPSESSPQLAGGNDVKTDAE